MFNCWMDLEIDCNIAVILHIEKLWLELPATNQSLTTASWQYNGMQFACI